VGWINEIFKKIFELLNWWFTVVPWERAIRVRLGKHMCVLSPGIHMQIPFIDKVYISNIRDRVHATTPQTLTTLDGITITLQACIRFSIVDIVPMYNKLHNAGDTISQEIEGRISEYVIGNESKEVTPEKLTTNVLSKVDLSMYGLDCTNVFLTDFVKAKTYRLLQGGMDRYTDADISTANERKNGGSY